MRHGVHFNELPNWGRDMRKLTMWPVPHEKAHISIGISSV